MAKYKPIKCQDCGGISWTPQTVSSLTVKCHYPDGVAAYVMQNPNTVYRCVKCGAEAGAAKSKVATVKK